MDLNRNFGVGFNKGQDPDLLEKLGPMGECSEPWGGQEAFSEPETVAIRDAFSKDVPWLSFSVHGSYGSWTYPYNYKYEDAPHVFELEQVLNQVTRMIEDKFGEWHTYGSGASSIYRSGGTLTDWVYEELGVKWAFVHELLPMPGCQERFPFDYADYMICQLQPSVSDAESIIAPQAWFGLKELLKLSLQHDC